MTGWQPIDTAQAGAKILVYSPKHEDWESGMSVVEVEVRRDGSKYFILEASDCQTGCGNVGEPSHWMPLPEFYVDPKL